VASVAALGNLAVASLDLIEIQLLRGAMRTADLSVAAQSQGAAAPAPIGDRFAPTCGSGSHAAVQNIKFVYQPTHPSPAAISPRYNCPVIGPVQSKPFCDTDPAAPAPAPAPASPFQPPWKTLPWPRPRLSIAAAATGIIIRQSAPDPIGQMLDLFV
jgi:hypothetical protein